MIGEALNWWQRRMNRFLIRTSYSSSPIPRPQVPLKHGYLMVVYPITRPPQGTVQQITLSSLSLVYLAHADEIMNMDILTIQMLLAHPTISAFT